MNFSNQASGPDKTTMCLADRLLSVTELAPPRHSKESGTHFNRWACVDNEVDQPVSPFG